jgi:hypothetical protein
MGVIRGEQALAAEALFEEVVGESFIVLLRGGEDYDLARL